jgi:hypothetical protein
LVKPVWQLTLQVPWPQTVPAAHVFPQAPQLALSVLRLTQTPLQLVSPVWQESAHAPLLQI